MWEIFLTGHVLSTVGDALMPLEPLPNWSPMECSIPPSIWSIGKPAKTSLMAINLGQSATKGPVPGLRGSGNWIRTQRVPFNSKAPVNGRVSSNNWLGITTDLAWRIMLLGLPYFLIGALGVRLSTPGLFQDFFFVFESTSSHRRFIH
jgi:hypothetical protein